MDFFTIVVPTMSEWGLWSYLLLALLVAVEGPAATLLGAVAASNGLMRPGLVFLAASAGNLTSDTLWYSLGYAGKLEWINRFGRRLGIDRIHLERLQEMLRRQSTRILFFAKLSMGPMIPTLVATGLMKIPWRRWFPVLFTAEMIWTGTLVWIGYHAAKMIQDVEKGLDIFILVASLAFIVLVIWLGRRVLKKGARENTDLPPEPPSSS
jgi:membrane protein DedA with SNARE-associated domain